MAGAAKRLAASVANTALDSAVKASLDLIDSQVPGASSVIRDTVALAKRKAAKKKNKRKQKKNGTSTDATTGTSPYNSMQVFSAPNAIGSLTERPNMRILSKTSNSTTLSTTLTPGQLNPSTALWGHENYLTDVSKFRMWEYRLTPLDAQTWSILPNFGVLYKRFKITGFAVRWVSATGTSTKGRIAVLYQSDGFKDLPESFNALNTAVGAKNSSVWNTFTHSIDRKVLAGTDANKTYIIEVVAPRGSDGIYESPDTQEYASLQGSLIIGMEGLPADFGLTSGIGSFHIDLTIEFIENKAAASTAQFLTTPQLDVDLTYPLGTKRIMKSPFWTQSPTNPGRYYYTGDETLFNVDATIESPDPIASVIELIDRDGNPIPAVSVFTSWNAVNNLGDNVSHMDGTLRLRLGDSLVINDVLTSGKLSLILTVSKGQLTGMFA